MKKRTTRSIPSLTVLKKTLEITDIDIDKFKRLIKYNEAYQEVKGHYKSSGAERLVYDPHPLIRKIQKNINNRIFNPKRPKQGLVVWPSYLYGSIPNNFIQQEGQWVSQSRDYISCASNHCLSKSLLKVDISDFYENIHKADVISVFKDVLNYPSDVSEMLAEFCCFEDRIPQGALTSSFIASAVLHDVEPKLVQRLHKKKLIYTRLVDDITVSSKKKNADFGYAISIIKEMLLAKDLPINENKLSVSHHVTASTLVHGLRVNFKEPRLPEKEISKIRASVRNLEKLSQDAKYRVSRDYRTTYAQCLGRVNRMQRIGHNQAKPLLKRVQKIPPLPSHKDIVTARKLVYRLEKNYDAQKTSYVYKRIFNIAQNELNILQRTFKAQAKEFRQRLKKCSPI